VMIQEGYSPSPFDTTKVSHLPLSSGSLQVYQVVYQLDFLCTRESLLFLNSPSMTSPYQCQFLSSKHQVVAHYSPVQGLGLLSVQGDHQQFRQASYFLQKNLLLLLSLFNQCFYEHLHVLCFSSHSFSALAGSACSLIILLSLCLCLLCVVCTPLCAFSSSFLSPREYRGFLQMPPAIRGSHSEEAYP
jgi:hypothetical protein